MSNNFRVKTLIADNIYATGEMTSDSITTNTIYTDGIYPNHSSDLYVNVSGGIFTVDATNGSLYLGDSAYVIIANNASYCNIGEGSANNVIGYNAAENNFGPNATLNNFGNWDGSVYPTNNFGSLAYYNQFGYTAQYNYFGIDAVQNSFGALDAAATPPNNDFGSNATLNTFGNTAQNNEYGLSVVGSNFFGDGANQNNYGNNATLNKFGESAIENYFGNRGSTATVNYFGVGTDYNYYGDGCITNSFGTNVQTNNFGVDSLNNNFGTSDGSYYGAYTLNTFGNMAPDNRFGDEAVSNSFGSWTGGVVFPINNFGQEASNTFGTNGTNNIGQYSSNDFGNYGSNTFGASASDNTFGQLSTSNRYYSGNAYGQFNFDTIPKVGTAQTVLTTGNQSISGVKTFLTGINVSGIATVSGSAYIYFSGVQSSPALPSNPFIIAGSGNTYVQANLQNRATGTNASADFVITANNGSDTINYLNLGLNNSGYNNTGHSIGSGLDGYLYVNGGNLAIGTQTSGKNIIFHAGGTTLNRKVLEISSTGATFSGYLAINSNTRPTFNGTGILVSGEALNAVTNRLTGDYIAQPVGINILSQSVSSGNYTLKAFIAADIGHTKGVVRMTSTDPNALYAGEVRYFSNGSSATCQASIGTALANGVAWQAYQGHDNYIYDGALSVTGTTTIAISGHKSSAGGTDPVFASGSYLNLIKNNVNGF